MTKTLFVDDELERIELDDTFYIEIPKQLSAGDVLGIMEEYNPEDTTKSGIALIVKVAKKWNLTEKDGVEAAITKENLLRLPIETLQLLTEKITHKMSIDKKKSEKQSKQ